MTRLEHLDLRSPRGVAKAVGTVVSLAGVTIMILYKGPAMSKLWGALIQIHGNAIHKNRVKGAILTVASCIAFSLWYIMQVVSIDRSSHSSDEGNSNTEKISNTTFDLKHCYFCRQ